MFNKEPAMQMRQLSVYVRVLAVAFIGLLAARPAAAQTQTWVSGVGSDANPCSRTAPCATFAGALSKTAAGGEIDALDPGAFGTVTITKAITIDGGGQGASVVASSTDGIAVQAGANDVVILRNLRLKSPQTFSGLQGIDVLSAKAVVIQHCDISGFAYAGIDIEPNATLIVLVTDSTVVNNGWGIHVVNHGAFFSRVSVTRTTLDHNGTGLEAEDNTLVFVADSHASNNAGNGWFVRPFFGGPAQLDLDNTTASNNGNTGILSQNPTALVRVNNTTIAHNGGAGVVSLAGGQILSFGNNRSMANAAGDGAATGAAAKVF
ncbi:MAG: hypothetical protein DMF86_12250 [Acidobacteria bacterium]|nr:MAG: hypothetical protein DMF86_12250 [Acidobacteriota bacterium]